MYGCYSIYIYQLERIKLEPVISVKSVSKNSGQHSQKINVVYFDLFTQSGTKIVDDKY